MSIIVPCYNQAQYLDECLQSVLDQTYQNWECIIVNDGSPDNTEEAAKKWLEKDSRFKYLYQENKGVSAARNFGIENAKGEWILPLDGDDRIGNKYLELASKYFEDQELKIIYCNAEKFGAENKKWELKEYSFEKLALENMIFVTSFFRKEDFAETGGFDEKMMAGYEDWEFWIRFLNPSAKVYRLPETQFYYRIKAVSRNTNIKLKENEAVFYIERKHLDLYQNSFGSYRDLVRALEYRDKQLETVIKKRKMSRLVNQIYSFFENLKFK